MKNDLPYERSLAVRAPSYKVLIAPLQSGPSHTSGLLEAGRCSWRPVFFCLKAVDRMSILSRQVICLASRNRILAQRTGNAFPLAVASGELSSGSLLTCVRQVRGDTALAGHVPTLLVNR